MSRFHIALLALSLAAGTLSAQALPESARARFTSDVVRAELDHLYSTLRASHADLYVHRSREDYDARYRELRERITAPMDRLDVIRLLMPFVAYGQIGHARIDFPIPEYIGYAQGGGTLLPLDIRVVDGAPFVLRNYSEHPLLAPGTRLIAINGRSMDEWLARLGAYVSAERPYMVHAQLESMFPRLFWLSEGQVDEFSITVALPSGADSTVRIAARPVMDVEPLKSEWEAAGQEREATVLPQGIAYLRPGPFYARSPEESVETVTAFVDSAFNAFLEAGAPDLILDLRGNPGGDNSFSDPMVAWLADRPFRFASEYYVKASPETRRVLSGLAEQFPGGISAEMLDEMRQHDDGERFAFEIPMAAPRADRRYEGRVWTLVDRHSYSNATATAAIIKDYGFGKILGEETSDLPTSYASSAQFTLPATGIVVTYPKGYFVRPSGDTALRGVLPDHRLDVPAIPRGDGNALLDAAIAYVLQQRATR